MMGLAGFNAASFFLLMPGGHEDVVVKNAMKRFCLYL